MRLFLHVTFLTVGLFLLSGCQTQPPKDGGTISRIQEELDRGQAEALSTAAVTPPEAISAALMPVIDLNLDAGQGEEENRFDVKVSNAEAREFFMGLIEGTPYNMVVHPDVEGTISLHLKNVTIPEVMSVLRDVYGYEFNQTAAGFQVLPVRLQSRIFYVNYLNLKRTGSSRMNVSSGQITQVASGESSTVNENEAAAKVTTEFESDIWSELNLALSVIIGDKEGRSITLSPQSGVIVVRAMPTELREVEHFLKQTQSSLHRQVILEAKIIEVELNDGFQSGINWKMIAEPDNGDNSITLSQVDGGLLGAQSFNGVFSAAVEFADFTSLIELLKSQGNVQVLSSPRVSTLNNQKAVIKVGQDEFFVTDVSSTTVTGAGASTSTPDITLTPFFSGIALDVTPQIDKNGGVTLHIHPSISEVSDQVKEIVIDGKEQSLPLALSKIRESDNIVHARNRQLIVIGGLMKESTSEDLAAVPGLGDIPFFGSAFRHTKQTSKKSELVILLRPIVINSPKNWGESMANSSARINGLNRPFHQGGSSDVFGNQGELK